MEVRHWVVQNREEMHGLAEKITDDLRSALDPIENILGNLEARAAKRPRQQAR